jgi:RHS repeat-associated protein
MKINAKSWSGGDYRYGFNGKELDQEGMGGGGATYDYGFRIYNPQIGRFLSVDPLSPRYSMLTPYQYASNCPVLGTDMDGLEFNDRIAEIWVDGIRGTAVFIVENKNYIKGGLEVAGGLAMTVGGGTMIIVGGGLDATGIGAILGVPLQIFGAGAMVSGIGAMGMGVTTMSAEVIDKKSPFKEAKLNNYGEVLALPFEQLGVPHARDIGSITYHSTSIITGFFSAGTSLVNGKYAMGGLGLLSNTAKSYMLKYEVDYFIENKLFDGVRNEITTFTSVETTIEDSNGNVIGGRVDITFSNKDGDVVGTSSKEEYTDAEGNHVIKENTTVDDTGGSNNEGPINLE